MYADRALGAVIVADAAVWATVISAVCALAAAVAAGLAAMYGARRKSQVDQSVADHSHEISRTEQAQNSLLAALERMEKELARQDDEHASQVQAMRADHTSAIERERAGRKRDVERLQAQIDTLSTQHEQCLERNSALEAELAELRSG